MLKSTLVVVLAFVATTYAAVLEERAPFGAIGKKCYDEYGRQFNCNIL